MKNEILDQLDKIYKAEKTPGKYDLKNFLKNYTSREERHYCAYLFAWLLCSPDNIKNYFYSHTKFEKITTYLTDKDYEKCELYYEYTGIRELIDLVGRNTRTKPFKAKLKELTEKEIFKEEEGDIQKKKPDLAFYFPVAKLLVLTEAKFERDFDELQFEQTHKYGEILQWIYHEDIEKVEMTLLGLDYYTNKHFENYPSITWEVLSAIIIEKKIKKEIIKGLNYQKINHPKALVKWTIIKDQKHRIYS